MTEEKKPLVTIVTITFNLLKTGRKKTFRQCLESVHNQSYENIEHIVVDGASTDGSLELIKEYVDKDWVKYRSEPDAGLYDAMNKGIWRANGKYIAFLNSDDFYHNPDAVKLSVEAMEKNQADFSYANFIAIGGGSQQTMKADISSFLYTMPFGHPTMFAKTSVLRTEEGFNDKYKVPADYDLIIRLILKDYKGVYIDDEIATYRLGGACCTINYGEEVADIFKRNLAPFYNFPSDKEAEKLMTELKVPVDFAEKFEQFAKIRQLKNIDVEKVVAHLKEKREEHLKAFGPDHVHEKKAKSKMSKISEGASRIRNDAKIRKLIFKFRAQKKFASLISRKKKLESAKEKIPVFLSSDANYAPFVATTICSIMDNTNSYVDFYVLDGGISESDRNKIEQIKKIFPNFSLEFLKIDTQREFSHLPTRVHFSRDMYTRFLIPRLKTELKKVIYSDVDVIFNGDIRELYEENLAGYSLGAVPYTYGYINPDRREISGFHERLDLPPEHQYFESGLLLVDCGKWRQNDLTSKLINRAEEDKGIILTPDQDVFNLVFHNDYKKLSNKYIVVPHRHSLMAKNRKTRKSVKNPAIFHFTPAKPWKDLDLRYAEYFWWYASMTPFFPELKRNIVETARKAKGSGKPIPNYFNKYLYLILNSRLRQPARKIYYAIRFKKIK